MPKKPKVEYVSISVPKPIMDEVDAIVDNGQYTSRIDFIKEAIRMRVSDVKREGKE